MREAGFARRRCFWLGVMALRLVLLPAVGLAGLLGGAGISALFRSIDLAVAAGTQLAQILAGLAIGIALSRGTSRRWITWLAMTALWMPVLPILVTALPISDALDGPMLSSAPELILAGLVLAQMPAIGWTAFLLQPSALGQSEMARPGRRPLAIWLLALYLLGAAALTLFEMSQSSWFKDPSQMGVWSLDHGGIDRLLNMLRALLALLMALLSLIAALLLIWRGGLARCLAPPATLAALWLPVISQFVFAFFAGPFPLPASPSFLLLSLGLDLALGWSAYLLTAPIMQRRQRDDRPQNDLAGTLHVG